MTTIFVTTGATVVFEELIRAVLDAAFVGCISKLGYDKVVVQYGKQGLRVFDECVVMLDGNTHGVAIEGFDFSQDIASVISMADLVISHAGTGSILDTLRLEKRLIVMVNDKLMDNHQMEIAQELYNSQHLLKCSTSLDELVSCVEKLHDVELKRFPPPIPGVIESILHDL